MKNYRLFKDELGKTHQTFSLDPPPEVLNEFRQLLKDGYIIRDILEWSNAFVIFERPVQSTPHSK